MRVATNMESRVLWLLILCVSCSALSSSTNLSEGGGDPEYSKKVNGAGTLFEFISNPSVIEAPPVSPSPSSSTPSISPTESDSPPPPPTPLHDSESEKQTIPVGDSFYQAPDSETQLVQGNGNPYRPIPVQFGVGSQAVAIVDQNFDLILTNQREKQENDGMWQRLTTALSKLESIRIDQEREQLKYNSTISTLQASNSNLTTENEALEANLKELQGQYQALQANMQEYTQDSTQLPIYSAQLEQLSTHLCSPSDHS